ncbi:MAG: enoyl-CoA hydratase/isomerase family protein [Pseudomonadota bacterium]
MPVIQYETQGAIAVITLDNSENRQNPDFAAGLLDALDQAEDNSAVKAVVITSSDEKNWSQGIDLAWLMQARQDQKTDEIKRFMLDMNTVFARLLTAPFPIIAAITGHAFGNGAMLASCCDFRFMRSDRGYLCFPEVDINIPFLPSMIAYNRKAIPEPLLNDMMLSGRRVAAPELEQYRVVTAALPDAQATFDAAMEYAGQFKKGRKIFQAQKRRMHGHILSIMDTKDKPLFENLELTV